jgi:hypothetical protein
VLTPVKPEMSAAVIAAVAVRFTISTPVTIAPTAVVNAPREIIFSVSISAPPSILSNEVKDSAPALKGALIVSLPAVPVIASIPVVSDPVAPRKMAL